MKTGLLIFMLPGLAFCYLASAKPPLPDKEKFSLVGKTSFSVLWWDIYDVALYTPSGNYTIQPAETLLNFTYHRAIESKQLIKETEKQWLRFNLDQKSSQQWLDGLSNIWPDIGEGDQLSFYIDSKGAALFYLNSIFIGSIDDANFSQSFIAIWLADSGPFPAMTRALKGIDFWIFSLFPQR